MTIKSIQGPATEPVTVAECKLNARIDADDTSLDALLSTLIKSARETAEQMLNRSLIQQTWELVLDAFPDGEIELGWPPVTGIVSVSYIDANGATQTLNPSSYALDSETMPGWLLPAAGTDWPTTYDTVNAVRVRFTAGYGENRDAVPESIKQWIKAHVALWVRQPEAASDRALTPVPYLDRLLDRERWLWA